MTWISIILTITIIVSLLNGLRWKIAAHTFVAYLEFEKIPQPSRIQQQELTQWVVKQMARDLVGRKGKD